MSMVGKSLSHYKILQELGRGGMGVVYRAEDTNLGRQVALKVLPPQVVTTGEDKERFRREAQAAAALNHPNIATVHDLGETEDGQVFIVMELVEGETLSDRISSGPVKIEEAIGFATQIAEGLNVAHNSGIVHRDVKPSNMMLTVDGRVKILDFGLAKLTGSVDLTKAGSTVGTAAYMSPEQTQGQEVDHRSDVWSLGVVLYEMLTGERPFQGEYDAAVTYSIVNQNPAPMSSIRAGLSPEIERIVQLALGKKFTDRYPTMEAMLGDLRGLTGPAISPAPSLGEVIKRPGVAIPAIVLILLVVAFSTWQIRRSQKATWARQVALPEIERLAAAQNSEEAFLLAQEAEQYIPNDSSLIRLMDSFSWLFNLSTDPPGATVFRKPYGSDDSKWIEIGITPIEDLRFPWGWHQLQLEKAGYRTVEWVRLGWITNVLLDQEEDIPEGMVRVPGVSEEVALNPNSGALRLLPGLDDVRKEPLNDFLMDKTEVTNEDYKLFVDAGGYQSESFWSQPFIQDGRVLGWEEAMGLFTDRTGQPGPATWEVGDFADGQEEYPVSGVSWYEAAAYAEFAGKSLPTLFHWARAARITAADAIVPASNMNADGPVPVQQYQGMSPFGTFDMAGNVREWVWNENGRNGERYILGGGWDDPEYGFTDAFARHPMDRTPTNGFRCVKYIVANESQSALERPLERAFRDFYAEEPVSDETFALFLRQYAYDRAPLNTVLESVLEDDDFTREQVTFDAAYGGERMMAYVFTPKNGRPPHQTVVYFPGSGALHNPSSENVGLGSQSTSRVLAKSGRAWLFPIYKNTYERGNEIASDYYNTSVRFKDHMIMWAKDVRRSVDFLESRDDIDSDKIAYYGSSWGAMLAPVMTAVETRFKASVVRVGGLAMEPILPEADPFNFLPRVTVPTLMLNGQYDYFFPYQSSQLPFFQRLGTREEDKEMVVTEGAHYVPRDVWIREFLGWLDKYLGPVVK